MSGCCRRGFQREKYVGVGAGVTNSEGRVFPTNDLGVLGQEGQEARPMRWRVRGTSMFKGSHKTLRRTSLGNGQMRLANTGTGGLEGV